jgi:hypothetical protein
MTEMAVQRGALSNPRLRKAGGDILLTAKNYASKAAPPFAGIAWEVDPHRLEQGTSDQAVNLLQSHFGVRKE